MKFIYIQKTVRVLFFAAIVIASAGYAYLGDRFGSIWPDQLSWDQRIIVWPTGVAFQITEDRVKADILACVIWFVLQALVLIVVYFAACFATSGPNENGKDI